MTQIDNYLSFRLESDLKGSTIRRVGWFISMSMAGDHLPLFLQRFTGSCRSLVCPSTVRRTWPAPALWPVPVLWLAPAMAALLHFEPSPVGHHSSEYIVHLPVSIPRPGKNSHHRQKKLSVRNHPISYCIYLHNLPVVSFCNISHNLPSPVGWFMQNSYVH